MNIIQPLHNLFKDLKAEYNSFQINSLRSKLALKSTAAGTLAVLLALLLNIPDAFWAGISAFVVIQAKLGATLQRGVSRALGTLLGAGLGILVASLWGNDAIYFISCIFIVTAAGLYQACKSSNSYLWILGTATFLMVTITVIIQPDQVVQVAGYRSLEIIIGIFSAWLISTFFSGRAKDNLATDTVLLINKLQHFLTNCLQDYQLAQVNWEQRYQEYKEFKNLLDYQYRLYKYIWFEYLHAPKIYAVWVNLHEALELSGTLLVNFYEKHNPANFVEVQGYYFTAELHVIQQAAADCLQQLNDCITNHIEFVILKQYFIHWQNAVNALKLKLALVAPPEAAATLSINKIKQLAQLLFTQQQILLNLHKSIEQPKTKLTKAWHVNLKSLKAWTKNIINHDLHFIQYGIKGAIGILTVPIIWVGFNLPGLDQIAVSVIAVIQLDTLVTHQKGWLRIYGCLAGALLAFLLIGMNITQLTLLLIALFIALFIFAYIHHGSTQINYFGTQAAVALFIGTINDLGPIQILSPTVERLIGIIAGVCIVVLVNQLLWPLVGIRLLKHRLNQFKFSLIPIKHYLTRKIYLGKNQHNYIIEWRKFVTARIALKEISSADYDDNSINNLAKSLFDVQRIIYYELFMLTSLHKHLLNKVACRLFLQEVQQLTKELLTILFASIPSNNLIKLQTRLQLFNEKLLYFLQVNKLINAYTSADHVDDYLYSLALQEVLKDLGGLLASWLKLAKLLALKNLYAAA